MSNRDALVASGVAADESFASKPPTDPVLPCQKKTWVEVRLIDTDGKPIANEPFRIEMPDGSVHQGTTDAEGLGGVELIAPGEGVLSLPNRVTGEADLEH